MKKFKTRKEILENPESKRLLFEFLLEYTDNPEDEVETYVKFFIDRKMKQCILEGV